MTDPRNPHSEYLSDQGKRTYLLEYLVSLSEGIYDLSTELLALDHGNLNEGELAGVNDRAVTAAMNVLGDWVSIHPMLVDMYRDNQPLSTPESMG